MFFILYKTSNYMCQQIEGVEVEVGMCLGIFECFSECEGLYVWPKEHAKLRKKWAETSTGLNTDWGKTVISNFLEKEGTSSTPSSSSSPQNV